MANENTQEILDGILEGLRSDDRVRLLDLSASSKRTISAVRRYAVNWKN